MVIEESLKTEVRYDVDVLVAGGGFAGIAAALAATRSKKSVLLIDRGFMLGGLGTAGLINIYLPLCDGLGRQVSFGLAEELLRLSVEDMASHTRGYDNWVLSDDPAGRTEKTSRFEVDFNPAFFAIRAEQKLLEEGVKILYGTYAVMAHRDGARVDAVMAENKSGRFAIRARAFVDATGDADLGAFAGVPTATFGQGNILAAWYYYSDKNGYNRRLLGACDIPEDEKIPGKKMDYLMDRRFTGLDGEEISEFVEASHASTLNDVKKHRKEDPTYEPTTIATIPQLRMTRRVAGDYTLDVPEMHKRFEDSIGLVSDWRKRGPVWEVPFGTLKNRAAENLFFAGRCTSVTDSLWDVMRVIPCCSVTGEAAGVAAALYADCGDVSLSSLQQTLKARGVVLHESDLG